MKAKGIAINDPDLSILLESYCNVKVADYFNMTFKDLSILLESYCNSRATTRS